LSTSPNIEILQKEEKIAEKCRKCIF
jgi:hypothetical protein